MSRSSRFVGATLALAALSGGSFIAATTATAGSVRHHQRGATAFPFVYAGYADTYRPGAPSAPSPWKGSTGVIFKGCNYFHPDRCPKNKKGKDRYDAGTLRFSSGSAAFSFTVSNVSVTIGSCTFKPWPGLSVTVAPPQHDLILTQTGGKAPCHTAGNAFNFDSSETNPSCTPSQVMPVVTATVNGSVVKYTDFSQTLNTGGFDAGSKACGHHNETHAWVLISGG